MLRIEDGTVVIGGRSMIVRRSGLRVGPTVLLLHALGLYRRAFDPLSPALGGSLDIIPYHHRRPGSRPSGERFTHPMLVGDAVYIMHLYKRQIYVCGPHPGRLLR